MTKEFVYGVVLDETNAYSSLVIVMILHLCLGLSCTAECLHWYAPDNAVFLPLSSSALHLDPEFGVSKLRFKS